MSRRAPSCRSPTRGTFPRRSRRHLPPPHRHRVKRPRRACSSRPRLRPLRALGRINHRGRSRNRRRRHPPRSGRNSSGATQTINSLVRLNRLRRPSASRSHLRPARARKTATSCERRKNPARPLPPRRRRHLLPHRLLHPLRQRSRARPPPSRQFAGGRLATRAPSRLASRLRRRPTFDRPTARRAGASSAVDGRSRERPIAARSGRQPRCRRMAW